MQQRVELPNFSAYAQTPVYNVGGEVVFGLLKSVVVASNTDSLYTVPPAGANRLDLISAEFYGVPDLWWVLASVNKITDPLVGPATGDIIRIPTRDRLANEGVLNI